MRKYIDYNEYLNMRKNIFSRYKIYKNNKQFLKENISKELIFNNIKLDNKQKEAIYTDEINTLVLSGAGSGKTLTIASKIDYLIKNGIKKEEILILSFTNASVEDLKKKINYSLDIYTFHKLALEIISDYKKNYSIISDYLEYIIREIFLSICFDIDEKNLNFFVKEISSFINLFKTYNYDNNYFNKLLKRNKSLLLKVIEKIYYIYEDELYSQGLIDFNDMISLSINLINKYGLKRYYKYIIIDEFQDISLLRYKLIKLIKESCNSKLFCVGDDYQSIYKFSGSNIYMIINFKKYFGYTKIIKINNTYRNSYELILVASKFINKNYHQINKKLFSTKHIPKPIKIIYYLKNMNVKFKKLLDMLYGNVLVLGRNNYDIKYVIDEEITYNEVIFYKNRTFEYKTVHKSKGLESDNVIVLNMTNSIYGFPNKKSNDLQKLILEKDKYLYEEERRLFYVALTRTKNNVYLLVDRQNPSIFIKELLYNSKKYIETLDL